MAHRLDAYLSSSERELRSRRRWYWVALALMVASLIFHQALIFVAGLLALFLAALPEVWYRFCLTGVVYERHLAESRVMFGEQISLRVRIENRKLLPLPWIEVRDELPEALAPPTGRVELHDARAGYVVLINTFSLWWYQRVTRRYQIPGLKRGVFTLGPLKLESGDPFGLLTREQERRLLDTVLVYPPVLPIERFGLPPRHPFGERAAPRRLLEDPARVVGVRDWLPGDGLRRVHWKASARAMTLQSKEYEASTTYTLELFININAYDNPILGLNPPLVELLIAAAASIATWAIEQGYEVGVYSNGLQATGEGEAAPSLSPIEASQGLFQTARLTIPASSRREQLTRVLEGLARLIAYFGPPLEQTLSAAQRRLPAGATLVVLSSAAAVTLGLLSMLLQMRGPGQKVALLLAGDVPVEAPPGVLIYRLGNEETWHEIVAQFQGQAPAAESGQVEHRKPLLLA